MALTITRKLVDECRIALKNAKPYTEKEICSGIKKTDGARRKATHAKHILEHFGLSLSDASDYGNITD